MTDEPKLIDILNMEAILACEEYYYTEVPIDKTILIGHNQKIGVVFIDGEMFYKWRKP